MKRALHFQREGFLRLTTLRSEKDEEFDVLTRPVEQGLVEEVRVWNRR